MPVYELRIYQAHPGKLDALTARFAHHVDALIRKHGMKVTAYWVPRGDNPKNMLIYLVEHASEESGIANWASFVADPEWKRIRAESEANGPLVASIESYYMDQLDLATIQ
jgi:hypothetical protein